MFGGGEGGGTLVYARKTVHLSREISLRSSHCIIYTYMRDLSFYDLLKFGIYQTLALPGKRLWEKRSTLSLQKNNIYFLSN